jgi:uncharacterized membrane protein
MKDKYNIKQSKNFLSKDNIHFIENVLLKRTFPYYISYSFENETVQKNEFLSHEVLARIEEAGIKNAINSPEVYDQTVDILNNFCSSINENYEFFTRISYNLTFNNGKQRSHIHKDHNYPHKQIIIYLNDADKNSKTCILDEKEKVIKEIEPKKYTGVCFDDLKHYQIFPKSGFRLVLVATFISTKS